MTSSLPSLLELTAVTREFPSRAGKVQALDNINLEVRRGEFVSLVGASGSGKSTLLNLIAGLDRPTSGTLRLQGRPVTGPGPDRGLVFQHGAVYPWRTVERNVAFGLELLPKLARAERAARVAWLLAETGLTALRRSLPKQLSGGQRQRVAIARALACAPEVLLLDEPFGALDCQTKDDMQVLIRQIWADTGTTVVIVTHDVEEAVFLGQRVVVLGSHPGRIVAVEHVNLPYERDLTVKRTPQFQAQKASIEDLVRHYHRAALDPAGTR
jgi:NitT/TauT family transport system ATP-binding protein